MHVESRLRRHKDLTGFDFLVKIEATREAVANLVKSLQSSSIVLDVAKLTDTCALEQGDCLTLVLM